MRSTKKRRDYLLVAVVVDFMLVGAIVVDVVFDNAAGNVKLCDSGGDDSGGGGDDDMLMTMMKMSIIIKAIIMAIDILYLNRERER